jgi:hypothetical protein
MQKSEATMKRMFKVHRRAHTIRLTKDLVEEGFVGNLDGFANACTLTLVKPNTTINQAIQSLQTTIHDMRLRKELGQKVESRPVEQANEE